MKENEPKLTEVEIIQAYQSAEGLETWHELAAALGLSCTVVGNWLRGLCGPDGDWLRRQALKMAGWQSEMAIALLEARGEEVPCICLDQIGDNGPCPKHGIARMGGGLALEDILKGLSRKK